MTQQTQNLSLNGAPLGLWNSLSADILVVICDLLISSRSIFAHKDIVAISTCCSRWRTLIYNNEPLWKKLLDADFPEINRIAPPFALFGKSGDSRQAVVENLQKNQENVQNPHRSRYVLYVLGEKNLRLQQNIFAYHAVPGKCYGSDTPKNCFVHMNSHSYLALLDWFSAHRGSCGHSSNHSSSQYYDPRARELISSQFAQNDMPAHVFGHTTVPVPANETSALYGNNSTMVIPYESMTVRWSSNKPTGFYVSELGANFSRTSVANIITKSTPYTIVSHSSNQLAVWVNQTSYVEIYSIPSMKLQCMVRLYEEDLPSNQHWGRWINLLYFNHGFLVLEKDYDKTYKVFKIPAVDPEGNDLPKITDFTSLEKLKLVTVYAEPDKLFIGMKEIDVVELDSSLKVVRNYKIFQREWSEKIDNRKLNVSAICADQWKLVAGCGRGIAVWNRLTTELITFFRTPHCIDKIYIQPSLIILQYGSPSGLIIYDFAYRRNYEKYPVNVVVLPHSATKIDQSKEMKVVKIADLFQFAAAENKISPLKIQCKRILSLPTRRYYAMGVYEPVYRGYNKQKTTLQTNPLTARFWEIPANASLTEVAMNNYELVLPTSNLSEIEMKPERADVIYYTGSIFTLKGTLTFFTEEIQWNPIIKDVEWCFTDLSMEEFQKIYKKNFNE